MCAWFTQVRMAERHWLRDNPRAVGWVSPANHKREHSDVRDAAAGGLSCVPELEYLGRLSGQLPAPRITLTQTGPLGRLLFWAKSRLHRHALEAMKDKWQHHNRVLHDSDTHVAALTVADLVWLFASSFAAGPSTGPLVPWSDSCRF